MSRYTTIKGRDRRRAGIWIGLLLAMACLLFNACESCGQRSHREGPALVERGVEVERFENPDGSVTGRVSSVPTAYRDANGNLQPIDPTVRAYEDPNGEFVLANEANLLKSYYPERPEQGIAFALADGGSVRLAPAGSKLANLSGFTKAASDLSRTTLTAEESKVAYGGPTSNQEEKFSILAGSIEHRIVLKSVPVDSRALRSLAPRQLVFRYGLTLPEGTRFSHGASGIDRREGAFVTSLDVLLEMPEAAAPLEMTYPTAFESGRPFDRVRGSLAVESTGAGWELALYFPADWFLARGRRYPIEITHYIRAGRSYLASVVRPAGAPNLGDRIVELLAAGRLEGGFESVGVLVFDLSWVEPDSEAIGAALELSLPKGTAAVGQTVEVLTAKIEDDPKLTYPPSIFAAASAATAEVVASGAVGKEGTARLEFGPEARSHLAAGAAAGRWSILLRSADGGGVVFDGEGGANPPKLEATFRPPVMARLMRFRRARLR